MISLEKALKRLLTRARFITTVISLFCLYQSGRLHLFGDHSDVSEDTIIPGGTPTYISRLVAMDQAVTLSEQLNALDLVVIEDGSVTWTCVPATRGDGREGVVYVFVVDENSSVSNIKGTDVGLSIASSLLKEPWLSKNVYFAFIRGAPAAYNEHLERWFASLYRDVHERHEQIPLIRVACVFDFTNSSETGTPLVVAEGINGQSTYEDYSNAIFEVARELNYHLEPVSVYDSLHDSMTNERLHRLHHVFLNFGIPAFTFTRSKYPGNLSKERVTLRTTAEVLGKHLRAVSGIGHQLHHSSPFFLYAGPQKDVSMGVYLPLIIGLLSPLFVAVVDRFSVTCSITAEVVVLSYTFAGPLLVGLSSFLVTLRGIMEEEKNFQSSTASNGWPVLTEYRTEIITMFYLSHIIVGALIKKDLSNKQNNSQSMLLTLLGIMPF